MSKKISFRLGITQVFILFTLLVAGAITYNFHRRVSDVVLDLSGQITSSSAQRIIDNTRDFLVGPASHTTALTNYLEGAGMQDRLLEDHETIWRLMWGPLLITPQMQSFLYIDESGNYVQVRRDPEFTTRVIDRSASAGGTAATEFRVYRDQYYNRITEKSEENDYDPRNRDWYKGVAPKESTTWSGPFISATFKTPLVVASSPILDSQGRMQGVASVSVPSYSIAEVLAEMPLTSRSIMLAVDEEYRLIAHPQKSKLVSTDEKGNAQVRGMKDLGPLYGALQDFLERNKGGDRPQELNFEGAPYRVLVEPFPPGFHKPGWRLVGLVPRPEPAVTEATFKDHAKHVFSLLENPAEHARKLAASFPKDSSRLDVAGPHEELWAKLWQPLMDLPQIQSFAVGDAQGSYVQVRREPHLGTRLIDHSQAGAKATERRIFRDEDYQILSDKTVDAEIDPRSRPWYKATNRGNRILWSEPYVSAGTLIPVVSATRAVSREDGTKAGVVSINIPLYKLSDFVAQSKVSAHGRTIILNRQGTVVAYPDKAELLLDGPDGKLGIRNVAELDDQAMREAYRRFAENPGEPRFGFDFENERYIGVALSFPESVGQKDWTILSVLPEKDILGKVNEMLLESAILTATIVLFAVIAIYWVASAVARPINLLAKSIEGLRDFRLESIEGVYSHFSEVDRISQSILSARDGLASFQKYVPSDLVRQLMRTRQSARLGGEEANLTMLFTDVEGFTTISENLPADELMRHLSEYLDGLSQIILEEKGTIDKYIGDAIMAFWGAPEKIENPSHRACLAALRCRAREEQLNVQWAAKGKPLMHTRFGIHGGHTVVGNVGSQQRMNYTVIGDSVNLASRLEGINKYYGTHIIISEEIFQQVRRQFHCRLLDRVAVKGKKKGIDIYELLAPADMPLPLEVSRFRERYHQGLKAYWGRDWNRAAELFLKMVHDYPNDKSVALFLERCRHLQAEPALLGQDWEGTYVFTSK